MTDIAQPADLPALTADEVARQPLPGLGAPADIAFRPDDRLISFLWSPEGNLTRQLFGFDPETGARRVLVAPSEGTTEEGISLAEALRRERTRQVGLGVTQYAWAPKGNRLLIPLRGGIFVQDGDGPPRELVAPGPTPAQDAQFARGGDQIAYVRDDDLWIVPAEGGQPRPLTKNAGATGVTRGLAEFIAQEEMGRRHGFWWSPNSQLIAYVEVDERHIPRYQIVHQGKASTGAEAREDHHYPFAGQPNAKVRLGVISATGGTTVWMDLGSAEDIYLARVDWLPDGTLCAQIENRAQTQLDLVRFDPATGRGKLLLRETSDVWINLHDLFRPLKSSDGGFGGFIWASERTGFRHLYLYDPEGRLIRPLGP